MKSVSRVFARVEPCSVFQISGSRGGQYRLCWCPDLDSARCDETSVHRLDFGELTVIAPLSQVADMASHAGRTCVSGQTCEIDRIYGMHLQSTDRVMMMQTCGLPRSYHQDWGGIGELTVAPALDGGGATVSFADAFRGPGGQYRLCWCGSPGSCFTHADFSVDFAGLLVLGPTPLTQDRTCIAGLTCLMESFVGVGLSSSDDVWVLETCGQLGEREVLVDIAGLQRSSSKVLRAGGQYRLCWCHTSMFSCSLPSDFMVDLGRLDMVGVAPLNQDRTCISGRFCTIDGLAGHLSIDGYLLVLDSCGGLNSGEVPGESLQISSAGAAFTWAAPLTFAGSQYRLCWCPDGQQVRGQNQSSICALPQDFSIDFGKFTLLGPGPLQQDRTCISGEICRISGLQGQLSDQDRVVVMETCAVNIGRTSPALLYSALTLSSGAMAMSDVTLTFPGGEYRLCWCKEHGPGSCDNIVDFTTDFGGLQVLGPRPLLQHRTCVSGFRCNLRSFEGVGLSVGDQLLVLDTCAVGKVLPHFTAAGIVQEVTASGAQMSWGQAAVTARGGVYRLCWKAGSPRVADLPAVNAPWPPGIVASDFKVDIGSLTLVGVSLFDQDRTCISGRTCQIDGVRGQDLSEADKFLVLDTCSAGTLAPGWPEAGYAVDVSAVGTSVSWGAEITGPGGSYRICWCTGSAQDGNRSGLACGHVDSQGTNGLVDMGRMLLLGPSPLQQHRTCVAGRACAVDGLVGFGLSTLSTYLVTDTCGQVGAINRFVGFGAATLVQGSGALVSWGALVTASAGNYRLCWCEKVPGAGDCSLADGFRVDVGEFLLVGPAPLNQQGTCVSGHTCVLTGIDGVHLETGDTVLVLETCSHNVRPPRMSDPGYLSYEAAAQNFSTWRRVLSWSKITSAGSQYRLCWCSKRGPETCTESMDFGSIQLIGPAPLSQHRTCVMGQTCSLGRITGAHLSFTDDHLLVMETCGTYSSLHGFPDGGVTMLSGADAVEVNDSVKALEVMWTSAPVSAAGGQFRLCWCSSLSDESCVNLPDSHVDIGELMLIGISPLTQDRTCVSGQTCKFLDVTGLHLSNTSFLLILETCGMPALVESFPTAALLLNSTTLDLEVDFGRILTAAGGNYRMCWCAGAPFQCESAGDFVVDIGLLHVLGVSSMLQSRTCISGQTCEFGDIMGTSLDTDDLLAVLDTCGVQGALPRIPMFAEVSLLHGESATFSFGSSRVTAAGGVYQLCWCAAKHQRCETADSFRVHVGELLLLGPHPLTQSRTCVSGQSCLVDPLAGVFVSSSRLRFGKSRHATM